MFKRILKDTDGVAVIEYALTTALFAVIIFGTLSTVSGSLAAMLGF
jgi:Flp pilus assembly pilin Flp